MSKEDLEKLQVLVDTEGFDYAFTGPDFQWSFCKDEEFYEHLNNYRDARLKLWKYLELTEFYNKQMSLNDDQG